MKRDRAYLPDPKKTAVISADEVRLYERSSIRLMMMEEHETKLMSR